MKLHNIIEDAHCIESLLDKLDYGGLWYYYVRMMRIIDFLEKLEEEKKMKVPDAIKWLDSLKSSIGGMEHYSLWHYAEAIDEIIKLLKKLDERGGKNI